MLPRNDPDRIRITFDDHRLVANAGLILPATLAQRLGLGELVDRHLDLGDASGRANAGDKLMTLVASALVGGDCIDDADALRCGGTGRVLGCVVKAPSTLGTFLRRRLEREQWEESIPSGGFYPWGTADSFKRKLLGDLDRLFKLQDQINVLMLAALDELRRDDVS